MNRTEFVGYLNQVKYKPGFKFHLFIEEADGNYYPVEESDAFDYTLNFMLILAAPVVHIYTGETLTLTGKSVVSVAEIENWGDKDFTDFVYQLITKWEQHEIEEHFMFKGKHVIDPHPELKNK